jgi:hypothetical protein
MVNRVVLLLLLLIGYKFELVGILMFVLEDLKLDVCWDLAGHFGVKIVMGEHTFGAMVLNGYDVDGCQWLPVK